MSIQPPKTPSSKLQGRIFPKGVPVLLLSHPPPLYKQSQSAYCSINLDRIISLSCLQYPIQDEQIICSSLSRKSVVLQFELEHPHHRFKRLNTWFPAGGTVREDQEVWPCGWRCVTRNWLVLFPVNSPCLRLGVRDLSSQLFLTPFPLSPIMGSNPLKP